MKRIGTTISGTIIVELTQDEFDSLHLTISAPKANPVKNLESSPISQPIIQPKASAPCAETMTVKEIAEHAKPRLAKLAPKKKITLLNSIAAMFQFTGGVGQKKLEQVFQELILSGFLSESNNKITYR